MVFAQEEYFPKERSALERDRERREHFSAMRRSTLERRQHQRQLFAEHQVDTSRMTYREKRDTYDRLQQQERLRAQQESLQRMHDAYERSRPTDQQLIDDAFREVNRDAFRVKGFTRVPYREYERQRELVQRAQAEDVGVCGRPLVNDAPGGADGGPRAGLNMFRTQRVVRPATTDDIFKATLILLDARRGYGE